MSSLIQVQLIFTAKVNVSLPKKGDLEAENLERRMTVSELDLMKQDISAQASIFNGQLCNTKHHPEKEERVFEVSIPSGNVQAFESALKRKEGTRMRHPDSDNPTKVGWPSLLRINQ